MKDTIIVKYVELFVIIENLQKLQISFISQSMFWTFFLFTVTRLPGASPGFRSNSDLGVGIGVDSIVVYPTT